MLLALPAVTLGWQALALAARPVHPRRPLGGLLLVTAALRLGTLLDACRGHAGGPGDRDPADGGRPSSTPVMR